MGFKLYTYLDEDGRILSVTNADFHDGAVEFEYPDDFDVMDIGDYRIVDGALTYTGEATAAREEAEKQAQAAAEERERLDSASREYFLDGGKETMEQDIRDAAASGGEAKQAADTAAASVNEYMDALLGLNTTDETEATDAE